MKNTKKGFTLVELLVVIAILAILATVAILGYNSFTKKAELSVDQQMATQMNTALNAESVTNKPETVTEVFKILSDAGFDTKNGIKPTTEGYTFYWYKKHNVIVLVNDEDGSIFCPTNNEQMVADFKNDYDYGKQDIYPLYNPNLIPDNELPYTKPVATVPFYAPGNSNIPATDNHLAAQAAEKEWLYTFYPEDLGDNPESEQLNTYSDWIADFYIQANDDFATNSMGIIGQYFLLPWTNIDTPVDLEAGQSFLLLGDIYANPEISGGYAETFRIGVTYGLLVDTCKPETNGDREGFNCGAYNYSADNIGKSITVELRLYEPLYDDEGNVIDRTGRYLICNSFTLVFDDVITR